MSSPVILVGATGDLGSRVLRELLELRAEVRCLVRKESSPERLTAIQSLGAEVVTVDFDSRDELSRACGGGSVLVSTVSGTEEVIIGLQSKLLDAAIAARVPRFIPSDFAIDYRQIPSGENRNLNLREEFRQWVDRQQDRIRITSILNGAFMDMLTGVAPFILFPIRRVLCWGDSNQAMDWTTIQDTARYTAYAALDPSTPRYLMIAGEEVSARELAEIMSGLTGKKYDLLKPGGPRLLKALTGVTKFFAPGHGKLYPPWQGMQYMHSMAVGKSKFQALDNTRYPIRFTLVRELLAAHLAGTLKPYRLRG